MARFSGRTILITGAAGGLGRALARQFAAEGASLVLADVDGEGLKSAAEDLEHTANCPLVVTSEGDLSTREGAWAATELALSSFSRLDVLVNNAGGGILRPTLQHDEASLNATVQRNLWTALQCTLAALPAMRAAGYGRVVFIGADSVRTGLDFHSVLNLTKGGLHGFVAGLSKEFGADALTFNVVSPTAIGSPDFEAIRARHPEVAGRLLSGMSLGRPADPTEVADAVLFLASAGAAFITGQDLRVNSGATFS